jgi:hypothetical protein
MNRTVKTRTIAVALLRKGFEARRSHHTFYYLLVDDRPEKIHTILSHGVDEYGPDLLTRMRRQLRFPTIEAFLDFVQCRLEYEEYVRLLREAGEIE